MKRFVEGEDRTQGVLLPELLDDYVAEDNPVRVIDVFVDELDLRSLGLRASWRKRRAVRPIIPRRC
jgi:transposase